MRSKKVSTKTDNNEKCHSSPCLNIDFHKEAQGKYPSRTRSLLNFRKAPVFFGKQHSLSLSFESQIWSDRSMPPMQGFVTGANLLFHFFGFLSHELNPQNLRGHNGKVEAGLAVILHHNSCKDMSSASKGRDGGSKRYSRNFVSSYFPPDRCGREL